MACLVIGRQNFDTNDWISFRDASLRDHVQIVTFRKSGTLFFLGGEGVSVKIVIFHFFGNVMKM